MAKAAEGPTEGRGVVRAGIPVVMVKAIARAARDRGHTSRSVAAIFRATAITILRDVVAAAARTGRILRVPRAGPARAPTGARVPPVLVPVDVARADRDKADKEEVGGDRTLNCKTPLG
jgi:hypothetical protein